MCCGERVYDLVLIERGPVFTGIVEEIGRVTRIEQRGENRRITVAAEHAPKELKTGDSVAVSGVCLTAVDIKAGSFSADLAPETWTRTSFSRIQEGALVNLELPMKADGRFGGHIVQGHVAGGESLHHRRHSTHGGEDESSFPEARRSGQSGSRPDRQICREDDPEPDRR